LIVVRLTRRSRPYRRRGGAGWSFRLAARKLFHRSRKVAPVADRLFLADTVDWLVLWQNDAAEAGEIDPDQPPPNYLSPRP
jgi:hypothetical protein